VPSRLGPRFAIEALFLILVAVAVGLADLEAKWIVVTMAGAWLLASAVELAASRADRWPLAERRAGRWTTAEPAPVAAEAAPEQPVRSPPPLDAWEETTPPPAPVEPEPPLPPPPPPTPPPADEPRAEPAAVEEPAPDEGSREAEHAEEREAGQRSKYTLEPLEPRPRSRRFWSRFRGGKNPEEQESKGDGEEEPSSTSEEP
jgi:outer membrane biosynthesis protein TonB